MKLWWDFETFSDIDIKCGIYKYRENVELLLVSYAVDDGEVKTWDVTESPWIPPDLEEYLHAADEIWAHNGNGFERLVWEHCYGVNHKVVIPKHKLRDTMLQAYEHGFPGGLDALSRDVLALPEDQAKLRDSRRLIMLFCKPLAANRLLRRANSATHPEDWAKFIKYCESDVRILRTVHKKLPKTNYPDNKLEVELSIVDMELNDRGISIDVDYVRNVLEALETDKKRLKNKIHEDTFGYVNAATERDKLIEFILTNYGIEYDKLDKAVINRELANIDLPDGVRNLLEIRQEYNRASTAKYAAITKSLVRGDKVCGLYQFRGAGKTGRYAARIVQVQNLPSRDVPDQARIDGFIEFTKLGMADVYTKDIMDFASYSLRSAIVPSKGKKFCVADWSNIEGRLVAWFAGEDWKLKAFSDFDKGIGHDLYKLSYARSFNRPIESVDKGGRFIGKVLELSMSYSGGVGAIVVFASGGVDLNVLKDQIYDTLDPTLVDQAKSHLSYMRDLNRTYGLTDDVFVMCDVLKRSWRLAHPATTQLWKDLTDGMHTALANAERDGDHAAPVAIGKHLKMKVMRHFNRLVVRLPSGRYLNYAHFSFDKEANGFIYKGVHPLTKKWTTLKLFSGLLLENICQATSAEILNRALHTLRDSKGLTPVLHVHDEIVCESPGGNLHELEEIMCTNPPWAEGLPLAAEGFEATRYRK